MHQKKQQDAFRDAIFIITEEQGCPLYSLGDELKVEQFSLSVASYKPSCLYLSRAVAEIVSSRDSFGGFTKLGGQKHRFSCGGCDAGLIYFEFKKERDFATLQMKLLNETEERRRRQHLDRFFGVLRGLELFEPLDDDSLSDLTLLLELKTIPISKPIVKEGDPGTHLYILLSGEVEARNQDGGRLATLGPGEIFGETSLLSGEPAAATIQTVTNTQVALLSLKNFRHVLKKYPVLQLFLFKLLVDRAQAMTLRSGEITSGMTGGLEEIAAVDLFQLINSAQKTGTIELQLAGGKAVIFFKDGQIVYARFLELRGKKAVFALLGADRGRFSYTKGIPTELDQLPPIGDFMGILMEGLQNLDESPQ